MGIEPTYLAWKARALPLSYTRSLPEADYFAYSFLLLRFYNINVSLTHCKYFCCKMQELSL